MAVIEFLPVSIPRYKLQINDTTHELTEYELIELRSELLKVVPLPTGTCGKRRGGLIS